MTQILQNKLSVSVARYYSPVDQQQKVPHLSQHGDFTVKLAIFTEGTEEKLFLFTLLFGEEKRFGNQVMRITKFVTEFLSYMCQIRRHRNP